MSFLSGLFLWAGLSVAIPIAIAFWNRRRHRKENFGGFFLLRKVLETSHKRLRLLELIKLLNRICLFCVLVLIFAEPLEKKMQLSEAADGFAIVLDTGRAMQASADGTSLIELQMTRLRDLLKKMPRSSHGSVLSASDRCEALKDLDGRQTLTAEEWLSRLKPDLIPYSQSPTLVSALRQCFSRAQSLFHGKKIYTAFISPMPGTLDEVEIKKMPVDWNILPAPSTDSVSQAFKAEQELNGEKLRVRFSPSLEREVLLIHPNRTEVLGNVTDFVDLVPAEQTWLWVKGKSSSDPWTGHFLLNLEQRSTRQIAVWAQKETPGFLSLVSALRNHPDLRIIRQVGGEPVGEAVIIYGSFSQSAENFGKAWFFVDPDGITPFKIRDKKQWSASAASADLLKSFHVATQDGKLLIKKYVLLEPDRFETLETFEDGAPSLLQDRAVAAKHWITPFDLEDLTTDVTLEPTFIPYLYRRVDHWLSEDHGKENAGEDLKPIWLLAGAVRPTPQVLQRRAWPGVYGNGRREEVISPAPLPSRYITATSPPAASTTTEEEISRRPLLFKILIANIFVELLLCLLSVKMLAWLSVALLMLSMSHGGLHAAGATDRLVPLAVFSGVDADRKQALSQLVIDVDRLSNLEFDKPEEISFDRLWNYPVIVVSSSQAFGPFRPEQREKIREYCERGGFLLFDDPVATPESSFYRSVKKELEAIFPGRPMKIVPKDDVLFRTYYLMSEVSGRKLASPYLEGISLDNRWVAVFSFNDLLGSQLRTQRGDYAFSVSPYGITQRVLAKRLFLNFLMYAVTLDYKDDAIHLPHILKRRSR